MICETSKSNLVSHVSLVVRSGPNAVASAEGNPEPVGFLTAVAEVRQTDRGHDLLVGLGQVGATGTLLQESRPCDKLWGTTPNLLSIPRLFRIRDTEQVHPGHASLDIRLSTADPLTPTHGRPEAIDATSALLTELGLPYAVPLPMPGSNHTELVFWRSQVDATIDLDSGALHFPEVDVRGIAAAGAWAALAATSNLPPDTPISLGRLPGFNGQLAS